MMSTVFTGGAISVSPNSSRAICGVSRTTFAIVASLRFGLTLPPGSGSGKRAPNHEAA
ncbi:MAG: hypothetical protein KF889_25525 [Alphaproteobacteria bacterium]|nr:hypothetical protein [Alphaproteobacteria bacterium]MCW5739644.1 hypothetical protein [Alphaproteobacteria bacterium]